MFDNMFVWKYNLSFLKERKALTFYQKVKKRKRKDFSLNQYSSIIQCRVSDRFYRYLSLIINIYPD